MTLSIYLPQDRLRVLVRGETLPSRTNGTALFADISGFTALTEALRNTLGPRRGAEELARHMEAVYSTLIGELERHGGSVIGFAGDSMLCWFNEEGVWDQTIGVEHSSASALAVACGMSLQRRMRAYTKITLPDKSTTALSLKVSIASGAARRFVVGDPNIQYIDVIAGTTITRTATGEHLAQKGEVLIDQGIADTLGDLLTVQEWRNDTASGNRFGIVAAITHLIETPIISFLDIGSFFPEELRPWLPAPLYEREQMGQGSFLTEFRPCTTLFVRFTGINFDSDEAKMQLNTFIQLSQKTAAHHGGMLMDITIGDKGSYIYINFGALNTHEDDSRRAVNTALELREAAAKQLDFLQPLQIGMTQGILRVGAYGGQTRKTFGALGDEVNLAARLMTTAAAGEVLVSSHMHTAVQQYFVFEPRPPVPMKGKAEPVPVFALTGERKQRAIRLQEPSYTLPMVGREQELKIIEEKLMLVLSGHAQVIGIVAEAGLGKSRLVAEVIRLARKKGFIGYGGACQSDGINTPYLAWKSIWSAFFDIDPDTHLKKQMRSLENVIEDYAPHRLQAMSLLNVVLDLEIPENSFTNSLEPQFRKSALTALFEDCLRAAAKHEALLLVIEDFHWIDGLSHDLLEDLAKLLVDCRICFVLAYRPPQITRLQAPRLEALPHFTKIELRELDRTEAEQAIRAKLAQLYPARSGAVPAQLVDKLMERAQGNPFYLEELLNYLRDRGLDARDPADLEKIELPDSLYMLVLSRIDQLSEREKTTLRVASIVGRLFRAAWLTGYYPALGDVAHVKVDLDRLDSMDITLLDSEPELAYLFKHIVTHEVTYDGLPFGLRAQLHEQLARYLERQIANGTMSEMALLDTLVFHYTRSENTTKQRTFLQKAGQAALDTDAYETAMEYFTRLLELVPETDPARSTLALQLAKAHSSLGNFPAARAATEWAQAAAKSDADRASALRELALITVETSSTAEALTILEQALPIARSSNNKPILCRTLSSLGFVYSLLDKSEEARVALDEGLALARELGDLSHELHLLIKFAETAVYRGELSEAERLLTEVCTRAAASSDRWHTMVALNTLSVVVDERGDVMLAQEYTRQAVAIARELGAQSDIALFLINLADGDIKLGNLSAARVGLHEALALALRLNALQWAMGAVMCFGKLAYAEGELERALALLGLARVQPVWNYNLQRELDLTLSQWALDPSAVESALARGAKLDWDKTIEELLKE